MPLDIGVGLILGVLLSTFTALNYGLCLSVGVIAALLPDLDYVWKAIQTKKLPDSEHRDGLHYPILFIPFVVLVGLLLSPQIGLVFALGSLCHFLHDSVGIGFGIKWLFPFKKNSYLFLFQIKTPTNKNMPRQRFYSWNDAERAEMIRKYAYPGWIKYVYFQPNPFGLFEYAGLLLGIFVAVIFN
jgi:hypothetical protein